MRRNILMFLLVLCSMAGQAQESSNKLEACIFEGTLTGVPDGSVIMVYDQEGGFGIGDYVDTLKNGCFHFERIPRTATQHYSIAIEGHYGNGIDIYAKPGTKSTIKGDGVFAYFWRAENDNHLQKELNEYREHIKNSMPERYRLTKLSCEFRDLRQNKDLSDEQREQAKKKVDSIDVKLKEFDSEYMENLLEFMKGRERNEIWLDKLQELARKAVATGNVVHKEKVRKLYESIPSDIKESAVATTIKNLVYPPNVVKIGDPMVDFTLYDLEGNEHHLNEVKDRYTILEFSGLGCGACYAMIPKLDGIVKEYSDKMELITISYDPKNMWLKQILGKVSWSEWNDYKCSADIRAKYGVEAFPTFIFISPDKKILAKCTSLDFDETFDKFFSK